MYNLRSPSPSLPFIVMAALSFIGGILAGIDPVASTIQLSNVFSMGTETRRPPDQYIPPVQEPYTYIIFRASEVKDLAVDESVPPRRNVTDDPAVLGLLKRLLPTKPLALLPTINKYLLLLLSSPTKLRYLHDSNNSSRPSRAPGQPSGSQSTNQSPAAQAQANGSAAAPPRAPRNPSVTSAAASLETVERALGDLRVSNANTNVANGNHHHHRGGRRGRGQGHDGKTGSFPIPDTEFDFQSSNARFDKAALASSARSSSTKGDESETPESEAKEGEAGDKEDESRPGAYNPKKSFFDSLSSGSNGPSADGRGRGGRRGGGRNRREEERERNVATFGEAGTIGLLGPGGRDPPRREEPAESPRPARIVVQTLHELVDLTLQVLQGTRIVDDDVCVLHLLGDGQLRAEASSRDELSRFMRRCSWISAELYPALDEQRHVQHAHPLAPPPTPQHAPEHLPPHGGVHDRVQDPPLALVREHERAERGAVERAVRAEDVLGPERARDRGERGRARLDDLAREDVRVDDGHVVRAEEGGDGRFAGGDSACEADDWAGGGATRISISSASLSVSHKRRAEGMHRGRAYGYSISTKETSNERSENVISTAGRESAERGLKVKIGFGGCVGFGWRTYRRGERCWFICALRSSSSIRHIPLTNASLSSEPVPAGSHSILHNHRFPFNLDSFQIARTTCPSSRSSAPTSSSTDPERDTGAGPTLATSGFVIKSTESPRHPAAWRVFRSGGDLARSMCRAASTFPMKTASYRLRAAGGTGVGRASCAVLGLGGAGLERGLGVVVVLRALALVRDVAVLRMEERSDAADVDASEFREDGGRERGGGGGGTGCAPSRFGAKRGEWRGEGGTDGGFEGR
ncbi:LOW QUALITY PROTEIN: hypothetical protein ACG7TL_003132 [Trametes sanguinea]